MTEPDLAQRLAQDLDGNFEALVDALQGPVYRFAYRWCGNPQDAEEIAQDAFVRAYRALHGYEPERVASLALLPWVLTIALNVARNRVRGRRLPLEPLDAADALIDQASETPDRFSERRETSAQLEDALLALPPRYRGPVILRHVLGLSYDEIGAALDQPPGTAKSNVHRGIQLLRDRLTAFDRVPALSR
jgi:RNA polymerase sigma-70 factor (ECF subfamily)